MNPYRSTSAHMGLWSCLCLIVVGCSANQTEAVCQKLKGLHGVKSVKCQSEEGNRPSVRASLQLSNGGYLEFASIMPSSVNSPRYIWTVIIGTYRVVSCGVGYDRLWNVRPDGGRIKTFELTTGLDISDSGEYASLLPAGIKNFQDAIDKYPDLLRTIEGFPAFPGWKELYEHGERKRRYSVQRLGVNSPLMACQDLVTESDGK